MVLNRACSAIMKGGTTLSNMSGGGTAGFSYTALFMRPVQGTALTH